MQFVLLKDGRLLPCTAKQKAAVGMAILKATDLDKQKIKLNDIVFTIGQLEDDASKIANAKQQGLPLEAKEAVHKNIDLG